MKVTILLLFLSQTIFTNSFLRETTNILKYPIKLQVDKFFTTANLSKQCTFDIKTVIQDILQFKPWALRMVDSSTKLPSGILQGNLNLMGNYDECLSIKENVSNRVIQGQYCTAVAEINTNILESSAGSFKYNLNSKTGVNFPDFQNLQTRGVPIYLGLCVPKSCSVQDLNLIGKSIQNLLKLPTKVEFLEMLCQYQDKPKNLKALDFYIYIFGFIMLLILITSTMYDIHLRQKGQKPNIYVMFSVITNLENLIKPEAPNLNSITCLHGIKVICCLWIVWSHFLLGVALSSKNLLVLEEWKKDILASYGWSGFYGVDSFFTISGLLITYCYLNYAEKKSVNLFSFYVTRFIRLTPGLLAVILIHTSVLKLFSNGPYAETIIELTTKNCHSTWWKSVLYYFVTADKQCAIHTWYVSVDSRFYLFAPLILFMIRKYPKKIIIGTIIGILVGVIYSFVITIDKKLGFTIFQLNLDYLNYLHMTNLHHMPSWLIGVLLGYNLHYKKIKISYGLHVLLLITAFYIFYLLITNQIDYVNSDYDEYKAALWNGFSAPIWSLALSVVIYSCATGNGGFINNFLSHSIFRSLSKLTYCMYLIHIPILIILFSNIKETTYFPGYAALLEFAKTLIIILPFTLLFYLGLEAPIVALRNQFV